MLDADLLEAALLLEIDLGAENVGPRCSAAGCGLPATDRWCEGHAPVFLGVRRRSRLLPIEDVRERATRGWASWPELPLYPEGDVAGPRFNAQIDAALARARARDGEREAHPWAR